MLDTLIQEGEQLQSQVKNGTMGRYLSGVDYEKWAAKCVLYMEQEGVKYFV